MPPLLAAGPSPRVRGSRVGIARAAATRRSIPACAGKPAAGHIQQRHERVHPRVCGEAMARTAAGEIDRGPSPRVRGSRADFRPRHVPRRSIPACAGEAIVTDEGAEARSGPSPRVRGKPRPSRGGGWGRGVHPRVCGEARSETTRIGFGIGPSPRVRGSLSRQTNSTVSAGSIPACAGKPGAVLPASRPPRVHPRVCGEAMHVAMPDMLLHGPSPRVRGSPTSPSRGSP